MARLTIHAIDLANGVPAAGVLAELWRIDGETERIRLVSVRTGSDGRTTEPLLTGETLLAGSYELVIMIADYFTGEDGACASFLERVAVRFSVTDPRADYHVPFLISPWSVATYRGS